MKSRFLHFFLSLSGSPPARVVWIEIRILMPHQKNTKRSPPARVVWIEICKVTSLLHAPEVATREGGVD